MNSKGFDYYKQLGIWPTQVELKVELDPDKPFPIIFSMIMEIFYFYTTQYGIHMWLLSTSNMTSIPESFNFNTVNLTETDTCNHCHSRE